MKALLITLFTLALSAFSSVSSASNPLGVFEGSRPIGTSWSCNGTSYRVETQFSAWPMFTDPNGQPHTGLDQVWFSKISSPWAPADLTMSMNCMVDRSFVGPITSSTYASRTDGMQLITATYSGSNIFFGDNYYYGGSGWTCDLTFTFTYFGVRFPATIPIFLDRTEVRLFPPSSTYPRGYLQITPIVQNYAFSAYAPMQCAPIWTFAL